MIATEDLVQVGIMEGIFSCACKPCTPASDVPVVVSALPSRTVSVPKSGEAGIGREVAEGAVL
jgi:hypothetical protein